MKKEARMKKRNRDSELLREGYQSYHKALFAVTEFRRQTGSIIQAAVDGHIPGLAAATKTDPDELRNGICPYASPDRLTRKYDGSETQLGVRIPKDWNSKWHMYFYLWVGDGEEPSFSAQVSFKNPGSAIDKLAAACKELDYGEKHAVISEVVPSDGSRDLAVVCDRVLTRWIALWRKIGGLRQFISKRG
jgi:hypothetical protein